MSRGPKKSLRVRFYRAGVLIAIMALVHQQARWVEAQRGPFISLQVARRFFPTANRVQLRDADRGLHYVTDARDDTIGCLLTTSPFTDTIIGYSGPNNLLIALDSRGAVAGLQLLSSGDTADHVEKVKQTRNFFGRFVGWKPGEQPLPNIEGVSGATLTSFAIAESIQQRLTGAAPSLRFPEPVTLAEAKMLFPNAARTVPDHSRLHVLDASGRLLGYAVRTSPQADNVSGYRGPTECLVAVAPDARTVIGLRWRKSYDTDSYVDQVKRAESFARLFVGRTIEELAALEAPTKERVDGISGATLTARGAAEGVKRRFASELQARAQVVRWRPKARDWGLTGVVVGALIMS
ncbi:MAG TPA: FMN-binding protein, partial [Verrucomicrobiae bacterium]|nr:FMN-binding protein [Verrucomicrobiae bacterium]